MAKLTVEIVTPERRLVSSAADEAILPGLDGLFGVRPGHAPLLSVMGPGEISVKDGGQAQRFFTTGGFVQVAQDAVRVLADAAEPVAEIKLDVARKQLADAEAKLQALSASALTAPPSGGSAPSSAQLEAQLEAERQAVERARARVAVATRPSAP